MTEITKEKIIETSLIGALTGLVSLPFQHPFDALKTNMQSQQTKFVQTIRYMHRQKGWKAFYNGFSMNCVRIVLKQALRWPLWITWAGFSAEHLSEYNIVFRQSIAAFGITFSELILLCPFERLKIWLMTTKNQKDTSLVKYFYLHARFIDLYTGFTPMMIRQGLSWSSFLISSQFFKQKWRIYKKYQDSYQLQFTDLILVSIPVALTNTIFIMPIDCIKTFYQQYEGTSTKQTFWNILQKRLNKNFYGLYLGWEARIIQYMIQSTFTLTAFEGVSHHYILSKKQKSKRQNH